MSPTTSVTRILVAFDESSTSFETLQAAVEMAAQLRTELLGMFVEDVNLLHLAGLPFAQEIGTATPSGRPMNLATMERGLQRMAQDVRETLADLASRARVPWSFQVTRGQLIRLPNELPLAADLLLLSRSPLSSALRGARQKRRTGAALFLHDGSHEADRALSVAVDLLQGLPLGLVIARWAGDSERGAAESGPREYDDWRERLRARLQERGRIGELLARDVHSLPELITLLREQSPSLVLLHYPSVGMDRNALQMLLNSAGCPLALIRGTD